MNPEVVIIGQNSSIILGQVRALGQAGYKVHVLKTSDTIPKKKSYELYSKYISSYGYISKSDEKEFIQLLLNKYADHNEKKVLIPCDDNSASYLDKNCHVLVRFFDFPNINYEPGRVTSLMNKGTQKNLAKRFQLNIPNGWSIVWNEDNYIIPGDIEYPCFVKPQVLHPSRKKLMRKCDNRKDLETVMKDCPQGLTMLAEQYINITQEYSVTGISFKGKVMVTSLVKNAADHLGVATSGTLLPMSLYPELCQNLKQFLAEMLYSGLFCIDLFESNGKMYFCECNLRLGNSGVATLLNGINLPAMLVDALSGKEIDLHAPAFKPKFFVDERVFIQKYWGKKITWSEYQDEVKKADITYIRNANDKIPYLVFSSKVLLTMLNKIIKRLCGLK